jgi:hypothetical protein
MSAACLLAGWGMKWFAAQSTPLSYLPKHDFSRSSTDNAPNPLSALRFQCPFSQLHS